MTKIDIVSGFLGAGKTTLIKKLLAEALGDTKVVLIENEFGEIGIDGGFLKEVMPTYEPERILIEPSGVGKLSDVMKAVQDVIDTKEVALNSAVAVVDAAKCKMYIKNFGEFFINQIAHAGTVILSRTGNISEEKLSKCVELIREHNEKATIITTPWEELDGKDILATIEGAKDLEAEMMAEILAHRNREEEHEHHHHHDHHHEGGHCCGHHHHGEEEHACHDHEGHGHHHDGDCGCDHHHDGDCGCGHHHDHDHHADEVFTSWGMETPKAYGKDEIEHILEELENEGKYGYVLRAKGMVSEKDGGWIYFDYVPGESNVRTGKPDVTGKFCVIGSGLHEEALKKLFDAE